MNRDACPRSEKIAPVMRAKLATGSRSMARQRRGFTAAPNLDYFGENRQSDFRRGFGRDIESDGCINAFDRVVGNFLFIAETLKARLDAPPTADHTNVPRLAVHNIT